MHRARVVSHAQKYGYQWTPAQLDALTSFDYNTGRLSQLTNKGKRSNAQIAEAMPKYNKAGGKKLRGLERRRKAETKLFSEGWGETAAVAPPQQPVDVLSFLQSNFNEDGSPV